jgi:hypothetical protein
VLKGIDAIIKSLANVIAYFNAVRRDKIKQELKKEQAGLAKGQLE